MSASCLKRSLSLKMFPRKKTICSILGKAVSTLPSLPRLYNFPAWWQQSLFSGSFSLRTQYMEQEHRKCGWWHARPWACAPAPVILLAETLCGTSHLLLLASSVLLPCNDSVLGDFSHTPSLYKHRWSHITIFLWQTDWKVYVSNLDWNKTYSWYDVVFFFNGNPSSPWRS